jgi:hypothetical protein
MLIAFATWDGKDCAERAENKGIRISEMAEARELLAKHRFFQVRLPANYPAPVPHSRSWHGASGVEATVSGRVYSGFLALVSSFVGICHYFERGGSGMEFLYFLQRTDGYWPHSSPCLDIQTQFALANRDSLDGYLPGRSFNVI